MKAKELMIGDWVKDVYSGYTTQVTGNIIADMANGNNPYFSENCIGPICVSKEILSANGFVSVLAFNKKYTPKIDCSRYNYVLSYCENYYIAIKLGEFPRPDLTHIMICGIENNFVGVVRSVHELQHAMRLAGLNKLADNFKIE